MRHVPRTCNTVFTYSLSLSGKFFYPQPKCLPLLDIASQCPSLPLDRAGRLRREVVDHAVDPLDLVDDAGGDAGEEMRIERVDIGGHAVGAGHGAQTAYTVVSAIVAHHAD